MNDQKIELLKTYLSLYIDPQIVLADMQNATGKYIILDVRNAPAQAKKDQIKGAIALPAKNLATRISELDSTKTYVVYDWTGGTILGKTALLVLLSAGFEAYELAGALEGWKGMQLPVEPLVE